VEEDASLMRGVARIGRKWGRLPTRDPILADRGPDELKQRHRCLDEHHRNLVWETLLAEFGALDTEGHVVVDPRRKAEMRTRTRLIGSTSKRLGTNGRLGTAARPPRPPSSPVSAVRPPSSLLTRASAHRRSPVFLQLSGCGRRQRTGRCGALRLRRGGLVADRSMGLEGGMTP
jgi:hypothetical protein